MRTASAALPVRANKQPWRIIPRAFQNAAAFFVRQSDEFIGIARLLPRNFRKENGSVHVTLSAYINVAAWPISRASLERVVSVCERGLGIAKHPQSQRPIGQDCHPDVLTKTHRQRTMLAQDRKAQSPDRSAPGLPQCPLCAARKCP